METKIKRDYATELDAVATNFNKKFIDDLKNSITNIKQYYQLTDEDICTLFELTPQYLKSLVEDDEDVDCMFDLRTIAYLTLLSNGKLNILTDTPSGKEFNAVNRIIKDYQDEKNPQKKVTYDWDKKVKEMLEMFGVNNADDMNHLLNAIRSVRNAISEYEDTETNTEKYCNYHKESAEKFAKKLYK